MKLIINRINHFENITFYDKNADLPGITCFRLLGYKHKLFYRKL